jgi:DNA modification methylase
MLEITYQKVTDLIPYVNNSRTHSEEQVKQIAASIKEFGFTNPILIDENKGVIAGHGRLLAAGKLALAEVPTIVLEGLTEAQRKAYVIADNKLALNAGWDTTSLTAELERLKELDFDLDILGFDIDELNDLLKPDEIEGLTDEDDVPDAPESPVTVEGDVWILGRHKIICGDATNLHNWDCLKIEKGAVVFSSPPYNLGSSIKLSGNSTLNKKESAYETYSDSASENQYIDLIKGAMSCGFANCDVVAFNLQPLAGSKRPLMKLMSDYSSNLIDIITWDKGHAAPQIAKGVMASRYEWIFLFSNKDDASRSVPYASWQGKWSNVYQAPPQRNNEFSKIHGATFPVHLPEFILGDLMNRSRAVVDCFCGTGTSIIAAEKLGKIGYGIEIDPRYVDVIIKRWQNFTGQEAVHENGHTFNSISKNTDIDKVA